MQRDIKLLDCTLRDGGYLNDWNFGSEELTGIFNRLTESMADVIEIGFLDDRHKFNADRTIQANTENLSKVYSNVNSKKSIVVAMIDYGTCDLKNIQNKDETFIDGIRVIFKKENMYKAIEYGKEIIKKGYLLFLQMVSITSYGTDDVIEFANNVNKIKPYCVSIVDTYGLMHKDKAVEYYSILDEHLDKKIRIGYHSHNNFQLAYSNTIEILNIKSDRNIILDGTLYGMGKSAGNAPIELLAMYLNDNCGKNYDISQMLEAIKTNIMPIYEKVRWGYSFYYYVAAKNNCHPKYVDHLAKKRTLSIKSIDEILSQIDEEHKLKFDEQLIEELCSEYIISSFNDEKTIKELSDILGDKTILLVGPGKSTEFSIGKIPIIQKKPDVITIGVNYCPKKAKLDYIFISNPERYTLISPHLKSDVKTIVTSNVTSDGIKFDFTLNYGELISDLNAEWNNALVIMLNLLNKVHPKRILLVGFDGFVKSEPEHYIDNRYDHGYSFEFYNALNKWTKKKIKEYRKKNDIIFVTKSVYDERSLPF